MSAKAQVRSFISTSKNSAFRACWPPRHRRCERSEQEPRRWVGLRPLHRRLFSRCFLGDQTGRDGGQRCSVSQSGCGLLQKPWSYRHARHDRPWRLLPVFCLPRCLPGAGHQAHPHRTIHTEDKRQSRTLHSDCTSGMGLCQAYPTSDWRAQEPPIWLHQYDWHRPRGGIDAQTPISRLGLSKDNLLRLHTL